MLAGGGGACYTRVRVSKTVTNPDFRLCESPIETLFGEAVYPLLHDRVAFRIQKEVVVKAGNRYRLDFAASYQDRHVGFECDGLHFHDFYRDRQRDVAILGLKNWRAIIRFRGGDIRNGPESCTTMAKMFVPHLFDGVAPVPTLPEMIDCSQLMACRVHRMVCRVAVDYDDVRRIRDRESIRLPTCWWIAHLEHLRKVVVEFRTRGWIPAGGIIPPERTLQDELCELNQLLRSQGLPQVKIDGDGDVTSPSSSAVAKFPGERH